MSDNCSVPAGNGNPPTPASYCTCGGAADPELCNCASVDKQGNNRTPGDCTRCAHTPTYT